MFLSFSDLDSCINNPCLNGGQCNDGAFSFTCTCAEGFQGELCASGKTYLVAKGNVQEDWGVGMMRSCGTYLYIILCV